MYEYLLKRAEELFAGQYWLSEQDLARILEVKIQSLKHLYKRPDNKQPPRMVVGHEVKFPRDQILQWFSEHQKRGA